MMNVWFHCSDSWLHARSLADVAMCDVAALIADLIRSGVDPDLIGRIAAAIASPTQQAAAPKTARQKSNARYYQKRASERRLNVSEQDVSDDQDTVPPKKETSPAPPKEKTTPSSSGDKSPSHSARAELETVLDAERSNVIFRGMRTLFKG
jgi:hypothetical protein